MESRRTVLKTVAGAGLLPVLPAQQHTHPGNLQAPKAPFIAQVFTPAELRQVTVLVDLIIPRTDTPGASDAGVPAFIDGLLAAQRSLIPRFRAGLRWLNREARKRHQSAFASLSPNLQTGLLTAISGDQAASQGKFFKLVKEMTIDGYYSSQEGLVQELGYHGNTYLPEFPGCTHPEHKG